MSFDAEQFVQYQIANASLREFPFPHFFVNPVFPDGFYRELRARLPQVSEYQRLDQTGTVPKGAYPERFVCSVEDMEEKESLAGASTFWAEFNSWLMSDRFTSLIMYKFRDGIAQRFGPEAEVRTRIDARLVRDFSNYAISPHTDQPLKLVSLLFYLPADESIVQLGTSIYAPKDPSFRCEGKGHHPFTLFSKVATMEFRPNSLFAFFKTDRAFHGVDRIAEPGVIRDSLLYNIFVQKVVSSRPRDSIKHETAWPWEKAKA
jgi:hypothetical protein